MPTPLEIFMNPVILMLIGIYLMLMIWEFCFPARKLPAVPFWHLKGIVAMVSYVLISSYLPILYAAYLPVEPLFNASQLPLAAACFLGFIVYQFGIYTWHRTMHKSDLLWRMFHQMHHSAERIDTFGAFYFSPFDMAGFTIVVSICFSFVIGLSPLATTIVLLTSNFFAIFQHANIATPRWLGYIIQRPESHAAHHERGVHANNYCDFPPIDIIFGTFNNPSGFPESNGFYDGASAKVLPMVLFKSISEK